MSNARGPQRSEDRSVTDAEQHLCLGTDDTKAILAELDAERDAHKATKTQLAELVEAARRHKHETDLIETGAYNWERSLPDALALEAMLQKLIPAGEAESG